MEIAILLYTSDKKMPVCLGESGRHTANCSEWSHCCHVKQASVCRFLVSWIKEFFKRHKRELENYLLESGRERLP